MLGDRLHVYLSTERHRHVVASVGGYSTIKAKETVPVYFDMDRVLFFANSGAGERLH
jgi:hypothetical protein